VNFQTDLCILGKRFIGDGRYNGFSPSILRELMSLPIV
jgi:hypothetical protein